MKTNTLFAIALTAALCSCSREDAINHDKAPLSPMVLSSRTLETKALDKAGSTWLNDDAFGVYAQIRTSTTDLASSFIPGTFVPGIFNNQKVTYTTAAPSGTWAYGTNVYWPVAKSSRVDYFAYHPHVGAGTAGTTSGMPLVNTDDGTVKIPFTVKTVPVNHIDLLYASILNARKADRNGDSGTGDHTTILADGASAFTFKHSLSKIVFTAKLANDAGGNGYDNATVEITGLEIIAPVMAGNFTVDNTLSAGTWTENTTASSDLNVLDASVDDENGIGVNSKTVSALGDTHDLLMVPQNVTSLKVQIKMRITYAGAPDVDEKIIYDLKGTGSSAFTTWEQGKKYQYNFIISLDSIAFSGTVNGWDAEGDSDINVPDLIK